MNHELVTVFAVMSEANCVTRIIGIFESEKAAIAFMKETNHGDWIEETTLFVAQDNPCSRTGGGAAKAAD